MKIRNLIIAGLACGMISILSIQATTAYFQDAEMARNIIKIGQVEIDLTEPHYDGDKAKDLQPNQPVDKDPQIKNTGKSNALVFVQVKIPTRELTLAKVSDGTLIQSKSLTDMFYYKEGLIGSDEAEANALDAENSYDTDNWVLIRDYYENASGAASQSVVDGGYHAYVFAYKTYIASGASTTPVFDRVQLKYIVEGTMDTSETFYMPIKAYAIQDSNILENSVDLASDLTTENLGKIYDIYCTQNSQKIS